MIYRLLIFILIISACQRKTLTESGLALEIRIDTSLTMIPNDKFSGKALADVHHLLAMGYQKTDREYDSLHFQIYLDPALKDSIQIQSTGTDTLYLTIGDEQNNTVALYSYLDELGYRFYGTEDHWCYIPAISKFPVIDTTIVSYFTMRRLAPSYFPGPRKLTVLDSSRFRYRRWTARLRMKNLTHVPFGHYGYYFNRKYRKIIEAHPEWRGKNANGTVRSWGNYLKLCYSNPGVIDLYKKDAHKRLTALQKRSSPPYVLNMEPPDGENYCQCSQCNKLPVSDQVYGLVNQIAEYINSLDKNAYVSLYAYNKHAAVPSFPLRENVIVGVVPAAFQTVGSPEKLMSDWESTNTTLYLRDYMTIPVWNFDLPSYQPGRNNLVRINRLKNNNYLGYTYETTASSMAVGFQSFLTSQASWKVVDESQEFRLFLDRMFPGFQEEITGIYNNLPHLNKYIIEAALTEVNELIDRSNGTKNVGLTKRLKDLRFYIEFIYLYREYKSQRSPNNINALLQKIMSEEGDRLLDSYGLYRVLQKNENLKQRYKRTLNKSIELKNTNTIQFELRRRSSTPSYRALNPEFYIDSISSLPILPLRNVSGLFYIGKNHNGKIKFNALLKPLNSRPNGTIIIREMDNTYIKEFDVSRRKTLEKFELSLPPGKFYKIEFRTPGSEIFFQGPNRPFAFSQKLYNRFLYEKVAFYFKVPEDQKVVVLQIPLKADEVVIRSGSEILERKNQVEPYNITIRGQGGKVITSVMYREGLHLVNIPHLVSIHPEGIIFQE